MKPLTLAVLLLSLCQWACKSEKKSTPEPWRLKSIEIDANNLKNIKLDGSKEYFLGHELEFVNTHPQTPFSLKSQVTCVQGEVSLGSHSTTFTSLHRSIFFLELLAPDWLFYQSNEHHILCNFQWSMVNTEGAKHHVAFSGIKINRQQAFGDIEFIDLARPNQHKLHLQPTKIHRDQVGSQLKMYCDDFQLTQETWSYEEDLQDLIVQHAQSHPQVLTNMYKKPHRRCRFIELKSGRPRTVSSFFQLVSFLPVLHRVENLLMVSSPENQGWDHRPQEYAFAFSSYSLVNPSPFPTYVKIPKSRLFPVTIRDQSSLNKFFDQPSSLMLEPKLNGNVLVSENADFWHFELMPNTPLQIVVRAKNTLPCRLRTPQGRNPVAIKRATVFHALHPIVHFASKEHAVPVEQFYTIRGGRPYCYPSPTMFGHHYGTVQMQDRALQLCRTTNSFPGDSNAVNSCRQLGHR